MKLGLSDLKTERQCRAAIGMDKDRFFKLLEAFKQSYLDIHGMRLKEKQVDNGIGYCINSEEELLLYTLFSLKSGLTYDLLGLVSGMDASNAKRNQDAGLAILGKALSTLNCMPKRNFINIKDFESYFADAEPLILLLLMLPNKLLCDHLTKHSKNPVIRVKKKTNAKSNDYFNGIENNKVY